LSLDGNEEIEERERILIYDVTIRTDIWT